MDDKKTAVPGWLPPLILIVCVVGDFIAANVFVAVVAWIWTLIFMLGFCIASGMLISRNWAGVLIDDRNVMSLSRLQTLLWTVIIFSGFIAAAFYNTYHGISSPLTIEVPQQVWMAMGISTVSLVGTPLILGQKALTKPTDVTLNNAKQLYNPPPPQDAPENASPTPDTFTNKGTVYCNNSADQAKWTDVVTGDELSNGAHLDLSKVQMLFFTIVIIASYAYALWHVFLNAGTTGVKSFPGLDPSTIALLGISHSGYLVNKAIPKS